MNVLWELRWNGFNFTIVEAFLYQVASVIWSFLVPYRWIKDKNLPHRQQKIILKWPRDLYWLQVSIGTVILVKTLCWWLYYDNDFKMLVIESICWCSMLCVESVTNISNRLVASISSLSATHFILNIRHQYRCSHWKWPGFHGLSWIDFPRAASIKFTDDGIEISWWQVWDVDDQFIILWMSSKYGFWHQHNSRHFNYTIS